MIRPPQSLCLCKSEASLTHYLSPPSHPPKSVIIMSVVLSPLVRNQFDVMIRSPPSLCLCESEASLTYYLSPPPKKRHNYVCCTLLVRNQFDVMIRPPLSTRHNNVCCTLPIFGHKQVCHYNNNVLLYVPFLQTGACTDIAHFKAKNQSTVKTNLRARARAHTHTHARARSQ